ncbi:hypothetical protein ANCDUO_11164 [Ancylostoma duodenale]|uniref:PID domain-containing protein n=1 Tax=Ancylostoma duodenale TaxID=51022 RepID=A0A0C2GNQ3_9BILA|nr:hypothetical protein ANCDUO_11164 [Ancylostoma duodenale]
MSWLFQAKIAKSHFYVWYLGSKEADGVRGSAVVLPIMRQLLKDSFKKTPSKATVQISAKGLKLIQSVPAMSRSGKIKTQLAKFQIAASCITYSMTGKAPFDDVVGVVMLVLNPEMNSPMHVHCYRCDSPETAQIMHANIQVFFYHVNADFLAISGLVGVKGQEPRRWAVTGGFVSPVSYRFLHVLTHPDMSRYQTRAATRSTSRQRSGGARAVSDDFVHPIVRDDRTRIFPGDSSPSKTKSADRSKQKMPRRVVDELKSKLSSSDLRLLRNSFQSMDLRGDTTTFADKRPNPQFRMFGDTLLREGKSRSLDNLVGNIVSKDLRGGDMPPSNRYSRFDMSRPFGQTGEFAKSDGLWKPTVRRVSSIRMNL